MEIGASSFGDTPLNPDGTSRTTAEGIQNVCDAVVHPDNAGLDYFGVGEHHSVTMPASSPGAMLAAAAAATKNIKLGSAASIISTDDPVRVFQRLDTADAISGRRRIEITAGCGSSLETFPLFGFDLHDYDEFYFEKLDLLVSINNSGDENVSWEGTVRPNIGSRAVVARPVQGKLPLWVATDGSPASDARAGILGPPISCGIIGGAPHRFAPLAGLYRKSAEQAGHSGGDIKISVAALGPVAPAKKEALERIYQGWHNVNVEMERLPHFLQTDIGGLPHEHLLESITVPATEVKPRVESLLAKK